MDVSGLDHVVLVVRDVERAVAWYRDRLGLEPLRLEAWRAGDAPFPSLRVDPDTIIDMVPGAPTGVNMDHLCLVVSPADVERAAVDGEFEVVDGPAERYGARGLGTSVYVRDPDGNTVELRAY